MPLYSRSPNTKHLKTRHLQGQFENSKSKLATKMSCIWIVFDKMTFSLSCLWIAFNNWTFGSWTTFNYLNTYISSIRIPTTVLSLKRRWKNGTYFQSLFFFLRLCQCFSTLGRCQIGGMVTLMSSGLVVLPDKEVLHHYRVVTPLQNAGPLRQWNDFVLTNLQTSFRRFWIVS